MQTIFWHFPALWYTRALLWSSFSIGLACLASSPPVTTVVQAILAFGTNWPHCAGAGSILAHLVVIPNESLSLAKVRVPHRRICLGFRPFRVVQLTKDCVYFCNFSAHTDLFTQAILMAGSAECSWAVLAKEEAVRFCRKFALNVGFKCQQPVEGQWSREANERMMEFLGALPASKFGWKFSSKFCVKI